MIFFSLGLPSRFADWCDALVLALVERKVGTAKAVALNGLDELAVAVIRAQASNVVICSRQPVPRLLAEVVRAERPFVVALDDPREALHNLIVHAGFSITNAVRAVASSCAAMLAISRKPNAKVCTPADAFDLRRMVALVAQHYKISCSEDELDSIMERLPKTAFGLNDTGSRSWEAQLSERDRAIIDGAVAPYVPYFAGDQLERLVWEPELFYMSEEPPAAAPVPVTRPIELTGRVRFLVYGPYINLPPGAWSADIVLGFSPEAAGMGFNIEVFAGGQLASARIEVVDERILEARLYFTIQDAVDQPVQIRIVNERAAFDGRLALGYVTITPQTSVPQEARERLENALRR